MDPHPFTPSEVEHLQRLIEENQTSDIIKDEQIKDNDILFFSQFGHLEGTGNDPNFQILQGLEDSATAAISDNYNMSQEQLNQDLNKANNFSFLMDSSQGTVTIKKEPLMHFAHAKFKELDGKSTRVFECGICGKEFGHQYTLMRHLPTHTDERKFHCLTCGKSFRQMSTLSQHKAIHSSERPYVCEVCNKNFNRVSTLISHRKTHTGIKPHRCHMCNKAFHQKGNLRNHIFTHTNERPYRCDICQKGFNQTSNLMCHKLKAHQQQSDMIPRYTCKVCGEDFLKRINLRQHEQFKHGMVVVGGEREGGHLDSYMNAIIVDPIKTDAMRQAVKSGDTPFALLRPLSGIPVLVRVLPAGDKQMLVPATAEDLKKYGHISIRPKVAEPTSTEGENKENIELPKTTGCIVQIKVPVVATVIQNTSGSNGPISMNVVSPGPEEIIHERGGNIADLSTNSFVYSSSLTGDVLGDRGGESGSANRNKPIVTDSINGIDALAFDDKFDNLMASVANAEIEFIDQSGKILNENDFQKNINVNSLDISYDRHQNMASTKIIQNGGGITETLILNDTSKNIQDSKSISVCQMDHSIICPDEVIIEKIEDTHFIEL